MFFKEEIKNQASCLSQILTYKDIYSRYVTCGHEHPEDEFGPQKSKMMETLELFLLDLAKMAIKGHFVDKDTNEHLNWKQICFKLVDKRELN